jgi:hypothetical protein
MMQKLDPRLGHINRHTQRADELCRCAICVRGLHDGAGVGGGQAGSGQLLLE